MSFFSIQSAKAAGFPTYMIAEMEALLPELDQDRCRHCSAGLNRQEVRDPWHFTVSTWCGSCRAFGWTKSVRNPALLDKEVA
jgi:hypothetical protein